MKIPHVEHMSREEFLKKIKKMIQLETKTFEISWYNNEERMLGEYNTLRNYRIEAGGNWVNFLTVMDGRTGIKR